MPPATSGAAPLAEPGSDAVPAPEPPPWGSKAAPSAPVDMVEAALATALDRASAAGEWSTVATLAAELAARRTAREPNPNGAVATASPAHAPRRES